MRRRHFLLTPFAFAAPRAAGAIAYPRVTPGTPLVFPRDHGSHPDFRTEWWYITAWLRKPDGHETGVQVTFFRNRPGVAEGLRSVFAPRQLLFAHAAVADPTHGKLRHDQRAGRTGLGLVDAAETDTDLRLGNWSLLREGTGYRSRVSAREFAFDLHFEPTQPVLLQGAAGVSRKGPREEQASFYYSLPQLQASGTIERNGRSVTVNGSAWLDHEWSSDYLAPAAQGWDWTGLNFDDGSALMAFRIRGRDGGAFWAGGTYRDASGARRSFAPEEVRLVPQRRWRSPRTGIDYPVAFRLAVGEREFDLEPLIDDQELDARASVGIVYWEGAVRVASGARPVGRGYLELTGYGEALRL